MPPLPRAGHAAAVVGKIMYIFGGSGQAASGAHHRKKLDGGGTRFLSDVHALDTETNEWRRVSCGGAVPTARAGHSMVEQNGLLFVMGGGDAKNEFNDVALLNVTKTEQLALDLEQGDELPNGSVLYVPGEFSFLCLCTGLCCQLSANFLSVRAVQH